mgnify:CR=1 FL=1
MAVVRIRVAELLRERRMSQTELARLTGLPRPSINRLVNHPEELSKIGIPTINALCRVFNVQVNKILEYLPDE